MSVDVHSLAGAYALDALETSERELFDEHMASCAVCATEVAELRETAARLADDTWETPPPRLRAKVLAEVASTRQTFPGTRPASRRPPALRWRHRTKALVAAAVAAVVASAGVYAVEEVRLRSERVHSINEAQRIQGIVTAPDAVLRSSNVQGGGHLTVVYSPSRNEAVIYLRQAKDPDWNMAYQFWLIEGANPHSAGVLDRDQTSATLVVGPVQGANSLGMSMEPAGGSIAPRPPILAQIQLT